MMTYGDVSAKLTVIELSAGHLLRAAISPSSSLTGEAPHHYDLLVREIKVLREGFSRPSPDSPVSRDNLRT